MNSLASSAVFNASDSLVGFQSNQGFELRATLLRITRHLAVFEIYSPHVVLQMSETLNDFRIIIRDQVVYAGRATVSNLVNTGNMLVCEADLGDFWLDVDLFVPVEQGNQLRAGFETFISQWQNIYKILPQYKIVVADIQTFLMDLRLWLEQVELGIRSAPSGDRLKLEQEVTRELGKSTTAAITCLFEQFEAAAQHIGPDLQPIHRAFARRQLHPYLMSSPFLYRTFQKPLGYAGDYEMVNMIARDPYEGSSLFARIVNLWFLQQAPAEAHRNRIAYLAEQITNVVARAAAAGRSARILSLGCGPALEVQQFLTHTHFADCAHFTLLDFNEETLTHARSRLDGLKRKNNRSTSIQLVKKSVNQILKEAAKHVERSSEDGYDFVYCAGLFDYLTNQFCHRLSNILYDWVAPGGLFVTTNVDSSNPRRLTMEYIMEWHLIYRNGSQLAALKPDPIAPDRYAVKSDTTGVNIYFEAKKPVRE